MKQRKTKDLSSTSHQQMMFSHFPGSRASVLKNKCHNKCFSLLLGFLSEQMSYGMEYPFGQFGSAVLIMFPPRTLATHSIGVGENVGETS